MRKLLPLLLPLLLCNCALLQSHPVVTKCYQPPPLPQELGRPPQYQKNILSCLPSSNGTVSPSCPKDGMLTPK